MSCVTVYLNQQIEEFLHHVWQDKQSSDDVTGVFSDCQAGIAFHIYAVIATHWQKEDKQMVLFMKTKTWASIFMRFTWY